MSTTIAPITEETTIAGSSTLGISTVTAPMTTITTTANPMAEYVVGGQPLWIGGILRVLPWAIDDLASQFGDTIYERMLWDAHVKAAHTIKKKTILANGIKLTSPISDKNDPDFEKAAEIRDFCAQRLCEEMEIELPDVLLDMLDASAFGNKIAELVWKYAEENDDEKTPRYVLDGIKVKARRTVAFVVDRYMNIIGILSVVPGTGAPALVGAVLGQLDAQGKIGGQGTDNSKITPGHVLPREKFAILIHEPKDSDPRGTSDFRAAYTGWWGKMQLIPEYLKFLAQYGTPSIVCYTAPGASSSTTIDPVTKQAVSMTAQQIAMNAIMAFRNSSILVLPAGSKMELVMAHMHAKNFADDFDFFNNEMAMAILHQSLLTGSSGSGAGRDSRASAQVHQDSFMTLVQEGKGPVTRMLRRDVYKTAVKYNFGAEFVRLTPKVSLGRVPQPDQAATLASYGQLGLEVVPSQFADIYESLDLPEASPEDIQQLVDRAQSLALGVLPTRTSPQQLAINPENVPVPQTPAQSGGVTGNNNRSNRSKSTVSSGRG